MSSNPCSPSSPAASRAAASTPTPCSVQPYSNSYSSWALDAATTYYRNTGDTAFAQQILPWLEGQVAYDATLTDSDGLIVTGPQISTTDGGYDWDFYDGAKTGVVTAFNDLYYQVLGDVTYIEASLGNTAKATAYNQAADHVRDAINANLLNPATGTYYLSESDHSTFAQDANALSVLGRDSATGRGEGAEAVVRVRLRNAGTRQGCETVQIYASRRDSASNGQCGGRAPAYLNPLRRNIREALTDLFGQAGYAAQDWTTSIRYICGQCSEGQPPEDHEHPAPPFATERRFGLAAALDEAARLLGDWAAVQPCTRRHGDPVVVG
jgi:Bacterial alpha-L-rhamnosidase 6 hairpin glycosidase domain